MKIDLDTVLKDIDGDNIANGKKEMTIGSALGLSVMQSKADPLRAFILATDIYKARGEYEINKSDIEFIEESIKESSFFTIVRGQLLSIIANNKNVKTD